MFLISVLYELYRFILDRLLYIRVYDKFICFIFSDTLVYFILVVFMGSSKYPDENAFDSYIKKHGGNDNAFTDCERVILYILYSIPS